MIYQTFRVILIRFLFLLSPSVEHIPLAQRTTGFSDYIPNKKFSGFVIQTFTKTTFTHCAHLCLFTAECISFNHCNSLRCELNSADVFASNTNFEDSPICNYFGMPKDDKPFCSEKGVMRSVQDDSSENICKINGKRQDSKLSDWTVLLEIDNSKELKRVRERKCSGTVAHGGLNTCEKDVLEVMEWVKFVHNAVFWQEAVDYCENIGGQLFYNINGTLEQLQFFASKFTRAYFIGLWTEDYVIWKTLDGKVVPGELLFWAPNEPGGIENRMAAYDLGLIDVKNPYKAEILCDVI